MGFSELELALALGESASSFNLEKAVCNHGFFMTAPNRWIPSTSTLQRPLRLSDSLTSVTASISRPPDSSSVLIRISTIDDDRTISSSDRHAILRQVSRMLRISESDERDVRDFHEIHPQAKEMNFCRIFRSPTLFEDFIKSILLCNCTWNRTLKMCQSLCELQWQLAHGPGSHLKKDHNLISGNKKRKRGSKKNDEDDEASSYPNLLTDEERPLGNFPSPEELVSLDEHFLKVCCNLGYRAEIVLKVAKKVVDGKLDLEKLDGAKEVSPAGQVYERLVKIKGLGPFTCSTILMCIGFYEKVPADSETINLLKEVHSWRCNRATLTRDIDETYGKYSPFQCLAYWFELVGLYEMKFGKLCEMESTRYCTVTNSFDSKVISKGRRRTGESTSASQQQQATIHGG